MREYMSCVFFILNYNLHENMRLWQAVVYFIW